MELPTHLKEIRQQLLSDEISWSEALDSLKTARKKKPWQNKEWKLERARLIKDSCAQCGQSDVDSIMVLQHLWQPKKFKSVLSGIKGGCIAANAEAKKNYIAERKKKSVKLNNIVVGDRACCPKCESVSIKLVKSTQEWKCYGTKSRKTKSGYSRQITCGHSFKNPATTKEFTVEQKNEINKIKKKIWSDACAKFNVEPKEIAERYGKQVVLESFDDSERYYSLKDTATFCKKCAYLMDVKKLLLCPNCKDYLPVLHISSCVINSNDVMGFELLFDGFFS
ncbi:hypothetical protein [Psychrobacter sp. AOP31-A1-22]|uniref:hypothetical protein n=1 Tax=Psychrobacter sp. AOP31-A1-22 TaxID=3457696 RepID=UPI0040375121